MASAVLGSGLRLRKEKLKGGHNMLEAPMLHSAGMPPMDEDESAVPGGQFAVKQVCP